MWIFTTGGFLSAVEDRRGEHCGEIVVRAREASALEALREVAPTLTPTAISETRDYRYRAWLSCDAWAEALGELGRRVDYTNPVPARPGPGAWRRGRRRRDRDVTAPFWIVTGCQSAGRAGHGRKSRSDGQRPPRG